MFGRRGPSQVKFTPIELRELAAVPDVDVIVYAEDFVSDPFVDQLVAGNNQIKIMTRTLNGWLGTPSTGASRRLHLHFLHAPVEVYGDGRVEGIRFERTEHTGDGGVRGTGQIVDYPVQAVYRAVGYHGSALPGVPFDPARGVVPNDGGRVLDAAAEPIAGLYTTGWIKRGPVGLIGHTKGDALETVTRLVQDLPALLAVPLTAATDGTAETNGTVDADAVLDLLTSRGVHFTQWSGWQALDAHERALGDTDTSASVRERVKVVPRAEQVAISRSGALLPS